MALKYFSAMSYGAGGFAFGSMNNATDMITLEMCMLIFLLTFKKIEPREVNSVIHLNSFSFSNCYQLIISFIEDVWRFSSEEWGAWTS